MRLLVIGGTVFLGRAVVEHALGRGDEVTVLHRGHHNAGLFGTAVDERFGDRRGDLAELGDDDAWDVVIDTCAYDPIDVERSAGLLAERVDRYVLVSSLSAYRDWPSAPVDESSPAWPAGRAGYGPGKAGCERAAGARMPDRVLAVRPCAIVGPHEDVGRLPHWLRRVAHGGYVLAPGPRHAPLQVVDARDLAAFLVEAGEAGLAGAVNAVPAPGTQIWGELLEACLDIAATSAELVWIDGAQVARRVADPWSALPLWPPPGPATAGLYAVGGERAVANGLALRPLRETVADTYGWLRRSGPDEGLWWRVDTRAEGLPVERERALVRELRHGGLLGDDREVVREERAARVLRRRLGRGGAQRQT